MVPMNQNLQGGPDEVRQYGMKRGRDTAVLPIISWKGKMESVRSAGADRGEGRSLKRPLRKKITI